MPTETRNLFDPRDAQAILRRIVSLSPDARPLWGRMDPAQALAHCSEALECALGRQRPPRLLIGRLVGWLARPVYTSAAPFGRSLPTGPTLVVADPRDAAREKARLSALVEEFRIGGSASCTTHPHPFFGKLSPREWSIGMFKHLDHHLRQFGA